MKNFRLYTFVANHYLSPLQCGLQTAHVVSELAAAYSDPSFKQHHFFQQWASLDKTIIICGAGNQQGVLDCHERLAALAPLLLLPFALFREDEQSMNGMATACGVLVPQEYWDVVYEPEFNRWAYSEKDTTGTVTRICSYEETSAAEQFISHIKGYRLA